MVGASENHTLYYNPRTLPKHPEEIQRLNFPFIEIFDISLIDLDSYVPRPSACAFLDLMERVRTVLLQDVAQLMNIGRTHILFDNEVFKTESFFNYR